VTFSGRQYTENSHVTGGSDYGRRSILRPVFLNVEEGHSGRCTESAGVDILP
jgi:hypothetical protein